MPKRHQEPLGGVPKVPGERLGGRDDGLLLGCAPQGSAVQIARQVLEPERDESNRLRREQERVAVRVPPRSEDPIQVPVGFTRGDLAPGFGVSIAKVRDRGAPFHIADPNGPRSDQARRVDLRRPQGVRREKRESWAGVSSPRLLAGWMLIT